MKRIIATTSLPSCQQLACYRVAFKPVAAEEACASAQAKDKDDEDENEGNCHATARYAA